eukprot:TRINITY_DN8109_c1_g1_i1.p1 TRINITY_DN8109_c1_g1~~TRINITY_DN8109_c1_g1_i1.p1  ORF type:complete len:341 (+),score=66.57 TRINITY_DN8109_c1_g1_i1:86-1108(+)
MSVRRVAARVLTRQVRWSGDKKTGGEEGLGKHFGASHEHKESALLRVFMTLGGVMEKMSTGMMNSGVGSLLAPKQEQKHVWGKAAEKESVEIEKVQTEDGEKIVRKKKSLEVIGVPINTEQFALVSAGEVQDHSEDETAWGMFKTLLTSKKYRTSQQQATDELYKNIPDFSEPEFLEDIESKLMPAFLEAFWKKDKEALLAMCSDACYYLNVETHLKQYEKMDSNCRLLMTRRANLFNRLMFIDDSDHAPSVKRRQELSEGGLDLDEMDDLDVEEEKPEAVFFVSCSAHIENEWVDANGEVKAGDKNSPEDWFFVFGLTPQPGPTWTLSTLEFTKMQAMA